jgi:endoglucanase
MKTTTMLKHGIAVCAMLMACAISTEVHAQAGVPTSGATGDKDHMTYGEAADRVTDEIKSYNDFTGGGGKYVEISAKDEVAQMGAGVSVVPGWDGYWNGGSTKFKLSEIRKIKEAGFTTIRIPLSTFGKNSLHIDAQGHMDPKYMRKLDEVVEAALSAKLFVIIDEHDYNECGDDADACAQILPNVWYELSEHFKNAPNSVMFEVLNEPHNKVDAATWNAWLPDLIGIIRQTNPTRNIIVGPTHWNSLADLPQLQLPAADRHIIVTFHYYEPMTFTHQGANWVGPEIEKEHGEVRWQGTADQMAKLNGDFDKVADWAKTNDRPILLGEYGTYAKFSAMDDRVAWTRAISKAAADRGFARIAWEFSEGPDGFTLYDQDKGQWVDPIKNAVLLK